MKFLSTLLLISTSLSSNNNIIGGHAKEQNCGPSRSTYLGCYENRNQDRALPYEMKEREYTPKECEMACASRGYLYFAREWMGQCFCSNSNDYDKHGTSRNCNCCGTNVGANKMCVYKLQPTSSSTVEGENAGVGAGQHMVAPGCMDKFHDAPYMGCYEDRQKDRALSHKVMGRYHDAKTCHVECNKLGYKYFARQWRGQCFCGNEGYDKHGITYNCNCCGRSVGPNKMCVWQGDGDGNVQGGGGQGGSGGTGFEINW